MSEAQEDSLVDAGAEALAGQITPAAAQAAAAAAARATGDDNRTGGGAGVSSLTGADDVAIAVGGAPEQLDGKAAHVSGATDVAAATATADQSDDVLAPPTLADECVAEAVGTFILTLFGIGSVSDAVLSGAQAGLWQVAVVWGFGVSVSIYATADVSGAHLNPAVSLALALLRPADFPRRKLLPFWGAQMVGAILAGCANLAIFSSMISHYEASNGIERGAAGSERSAMVFGEYFPNPAAFTYSDEAAQSMVTPLAAMCIEGWGTAVLMFVILAVTSPHNKALGPYKAMAPFFIGFTVAMLISLYAPLTQAGWNPARDFGPRIVAALAGWGSVAIPGPRNGFWIYILGPLLGAPLGGLVHDLTVGRIHRQRWLRARAAEPGGGDAKTE